MIDGREGSHVLPSLSCPESLKVKHPPHESAAKQQQVNETTQRIAITAGFRHSRQRR
jgi:hypothetical protein